MAVVFVEQLLFDLFVYIILGLLDLVLQILFKGFCLLGENLRRGLVLLLLYKSIDRTEDSVV